MRYFKIIVSTTVCIYILGFLHLIAASNKTSVTYDSCSSIREILFNYLHIELLGQLLCEDPIGPLGLVWIQKIHVPRESHC